MLRRTHTRLALLTVLLATQLGAPCGGEPAPIGMDEVRLEPAVLAVDEPTYYSGTADIIVMTEMSVQAVDLQLTWDPAAISLLQIVPHDEFDDDGQLAVPVQIDAQAGVATAIVDLRHGASAIGPVRVATVHFEAPVGAPGTLAVDGVAANAAGELLPIEPGPPITTP